ncbi:carboxypeptidase-like regulatory domain-containing protein [Micromonospora costi]|uniref:Carboxypeptidase regulatory-like domain-containing protein n=1 Tax=Micromonospora costi TaxID=1530042 RepID=A0A3B0AJ92_9ACTN|nr:carboxypeptidase-like regulatory domain-containing protein [Micromonospora costi]RKN59237.1 carboxypeptidase regulatory-like domain-containing protein [Micromonospora costi]
MSTHRRAWKQRAGVVVALVAGALLALPATPAAAAKITSAGDSVTLDAGRSASVQVEITPDNDEKSARISVTGLPQGVSCTGGCGTVEFEDGLPGVQRPARVTLTLSANGNAPAANNTQASIRVEGDSSDSSNLRVTVKAAEAPPSPQVQTVRSVSGKVVVQANGKAVPNAYVMLQDGSGKRFETTSDGSGNFRFTGTTDKPIVPGQLALGASFDNITNTKSFNASAGQAITGQRISLAIKVEVTPSPTPSASEEALPSEEPTEEETTEETPEATEGAPANASNEDSGGGFGSYLIILLGGLLVAAGVGTIVLLWMKRKENPDDADGAVAGDGPAGPAGPVPGARGAFRGADDQTRVVNRAGVGADPTMVGGAALSEAPTMMHRPVVDDVPPDPYGAPAQPYGAGAAAGGGWGGNGYGDEPAGYGGYGNSPSSGGGYGGADGGYGNAPGSGGGYGAGDGGYGATPSSGGGYGATPSSGGGYGGTPPADGGYGGRDYGAGYGGEQRYDEPTGRYTGDSTQYPAPADPYATGLYQQDQGQGYGQSEPAPYGRGSEPTGGYGQGGYDQGGGYGQQGGYGQEPPTQRGGYDDRGYDQGAGYGDQGGYGGQQGGYGQEPSTQRGGYGQEPPTQRGGYDDRGYDQAGGYGDQGGYGGRGRDGAGQQDRGTRRLDWLDD